MKKSKDPTSFTNFPEGYGEFPYIVVRLFHAIYMQIPIHFIPRRDYRDPTPEYGCVLKDVPEGILQLPLKEQTIHLRGQMLELTNSVQKKMEEDRKLNLKVCLVLDQKTAFYLDENHAITTNSAIPAGGTLVDQQLNFLAMNSQHFKKNKR